MSEPQSPSLNRQIAGRADWPLLAAILLALAFAFVAWQSVQHVNTLWDELNDHHATLALLDHPLSGSGIDGSQARLPMYVTAMAYWIVGASVAVARAVSIAVGAITILVTFLLGRRWFGDAVGLLAAALLACSPYFIGFARTALTEGDAFCPLSVLFLLFAFHRHLCQRTTRSVLILAFALGVATATKFYAVLFVPALFICDLIQYRLEPSIDRNAKVVLLPRQRRLFYTSAGTLVLLFVGMAVTQWRREPVSWVTLLWLGGWAFLIHAVIVCVFSKKDRQPQPPPWPTIRAWLAILPTAAVVCLVICPEHMLQPEVARSLVRRIIRQDHVLAMTPFLDPARLYIGIILFKLGLPLGALTLAAMVWAWVRSPRDLVLRMLLVVAVLYILLLTTLPIRQAFYLMSIYPLVVLMLAAFVVWVSRKLTGRDLVRSAWIAVVAAYGLYLLYGAVRVYPDFGLYACEVVGERWLGAEARGYRNLVQVTNDGTEDALAWCLENVPPGRRVVSYLWDDHVIDAFVSRHPLPFELVRRLPEASPHFGPSIEDADFVIIDLNNRTTYFDAPGAERLAERFDPRPVHTVWRGRGPYRTPVVQIYGRQNLN